jgi:hypothetical protein
LAPSRIIPLPDNSEKAKIYTKGTQVIALFPSTTAFYLATVVATPKSVILSKSNNF